MIKIYFRFILTCLFGTGIIRYFLKEEFSHMKKIYTAGILISYSISCLILSFYSHFDLLFFLNIFYSIFLHCIFVTDALTCQIPIKYNGYIAILGIIRRGMFTQSLQMSSLLSESVLAFFLILIVLILFICKGIGGGDVKLITVSALFIGTDAAFQGVWIGGFIFLLKYSDFLLIQKRNIRKPFGPELCVGFLIEILFSLLKIHMR